ncbi:MAG TPA: sulfite exporter TauE/SafE family protein [Polyangiaceae bacterium]
MTLPLLLAVLTASLLGSLHCAGMCGGFVSFYAGNAERGALRKSHLAYHLGRLATYTALGGAAGVAGGALDLAGTQAGLGRVAALSTGVLMVGWGAFVMLEALGLALPRPRLPARVLERSVRVMRRLRAYPTFLRAGLLGLSSTLLPCGWLYAFVLTAAGTASPGAGALVMAAFWSGTLPLLLGLGVAVQRASRALKAHLPLISAAALISVGLTNLVTRANAPAMAVDAIQAAISPSAPSAADLSRLPPCHQRGHSR